MQKHFVLFFILLAPLWLFAQGEKRVKFSSCFKKISEGKGEIIITGNIEKAFHVFSFNPGGDGSQEPTTCVISPDANYTLQGKVTESGKLIKEDIKELAIVINYYTNQVTYTQVVNYKKLVKGTAKIHFQVCNETMCERPANVVVPFDMNTNCDGTTNAIVKTADTIAKKAAVAKVDSPVKIAAVVPVNATSDTITKTEDTTATTETALDKEKIIYGEYGNIVGDCGETQQSKLSPWLAFLYGLLGGLAALFFPCTLPMIPMTISFFLKGNDTKQKGIRNGVLYGFFIFLVYFLLSLPFLFLNIGGDSLNQLATNVWVNILFFIIFIAFALSLFGFYDISLPSGVVNKVDARSNAKNIGGIFFMALTLAIVSFSCTGPILGLVLGNVDSPGLITPAMSGFGIGLGVPFALFAIFPNLLKALPKSGGWLTTLKVVFGFIEIAFALKFLSNADLVMHWGLLKREVFIIIWVIILVLLALYLFGKFTIKKGYENTPGTPSKILGILSLLFALYVGSDLFGMAPNLFGFPPPEFYSYSYKEEKLKNGTTAKTHKVKGLDVYTDLKDAMEEAKKQNKPVMIDFTGWACVNCRKMEENVWPKSTVYNLLKEKYVIASLYVDDKRELPTGEAFTSVALKSMASTIGDKWSDLQISNFKNAGQPFYVLIDPVHNRILNTPKPYTPEENKYASFLQCGLDNYKSLNK